MRNVLSIGALLLSLTLSTTSYAGATSQNNPHATSTCDCSDAGGSNSSGMPIYSFKSMLAGLSLRDTPLRYTPPVGQTIAFTLYYNAKDSDQGALFSGVNVGKQWTSNWLSYIQDDPNVAGSRVLHYAAGGGAFEYTGYQSSTGQFTLQRNNAQVLVRIDSQHYELRQGDGSVERYASAENKSTYPRKVYLSERIDAQGNRVTLTYDDAMRITTITDAIGQVSHFYYDNADYPLAITRMVDPFGRSAVMEYDAQGRLIAITDAIGMRSSFAYQGTGTFIASMTTPYGTTQFEQTQGRFGNTSASIQAIDPLGYVERTEARHAAPGIAFSESRVPSGMTVFNRYISYRNAFYWNKTAFAQACSKINNDANCDYTQAQIKHFLHDEKGQTARALESIKNPLESRIWFNYVGQSWGGGVGSLDKLSRVARVLDDGSTQRYQYQYNALGNITLSIDPEGRETHYRYADNGIDIVQIQQKHGTALDTLLTVQYNAQHLPTQITDAAGQSTTITYNARGQRSKVINALGQSTQYHYDSQGYLRAITNAEGRVQQQFSYDAMGRVASITDSEGYTLRYQYDALNRLISIRYPDNSQKTFVWDKLDLARITDREGKTTAYEYDANRNLIKTIDPLGQSIQYSYYPNGDLNTLTDKNGNTTTWERDIQGRVVAKRYADNLGYQLSYDSAGRLISQTDALGQVTHYRYSLANLLLEKHYSNSLNPTADVQFAYDALYPRLSQITDAQGITNYHYYPAGELGANQLKSIDGEKAFQSQQFSYDALGRAITHHVADSVIQSHYDTLNRLIQQTNALGQFNYRYLGDSSQIRQQKITDVPYQWQREYYGNAQDRRLKAIKYQQLETVKKHWPWPLSWFLPEPEPEIKINTLLNYTFRYSDSGRLIQRHTQTAQSQGYHAHHQHSLWLDVLLGRYHHSRAHGLEYFSYDDNGRLLSVRKHHQYKSQYHYDTMGNLLTMEEGGITSSQYYNALNQVLAYQYDANGNLISDGQNTYTWDAENRLIQIKNQITNASSEFVYDAYSRRISEAEINANGQSAITYNLWCGEKLCAQANEQGQITQRYFSQGEWHNGQAYFYAQDQVGSVTAMIDSQGKMAGTALYSPYGKLLKSQGVQASIAYAGLYHHQESGLYLATYRAYNPDTARWLNRDPIEENGGLNLYEYVKGSPVNFIDPLGYLKWSGSYDSKSVTAPIGATIMNYSLMSECVGGKKAVVNVMVVGPSVGMGMMVTGSNGSITFEDHSNAIDPSNLDGAAGSIGVSAQFLGWGVSIGKTRLGSAFSRNSKIHSGVDIGVSITLGSSTVTDIRYEKCSCEE